MAETTWELCPYHCPWQGATRAQVTQWVQELYGCSLEQWEVSRDRWGCEDAESIRREMYQTAAERIADDQ